MTNTTRVTQTTTVETVCKTRPDASHVFIQYKTNCVGCLLARFCTIKEVATIYHLDLQSLLRDLQQVTKQ